MQNAIVGYTGFVGSYLHDMHPTAEVYNSRNIEAIRNKRYHTVYCAGIPATKWWANQHPDEDWANIEALVACLRTVHVEQHFVLISTIDVYPDVSAGCDEDDTCTGTHPHAYGAHRYEAERKLDAVFGDKFRCVRLCGLFGFGLKKNWIYDFVHGTLERIPADGQLQWYCMHEWFADDMRDFLESEDRVRNLFTEPMPNTQLAAILQRMRPSTTLLLSTTDRGVHYRCHSRGKRYVRTVDEVAHALVRYLRQMLHNRFQISTLAVADPHDGTLAQCARAFGIHHHEIAPCQVFGEEWVHLPLEHFRQYAKEHGPVYSMQGLYYGQSFNLFREYDAVLEYTRRIVNIAAAMDVRVLVFGAPRVRAMQDGDREELAVAFFHAVSDYMAPYNLVLCIEPNARHYGCNFLTTASEGAAFVRKVDRANIRLMLDTGCMYYEADDRDCMSARFQECLDVLAHVHFSAPMLHDLEEGSKTHHIRYVWLRLWLLQKLGYRGRITLELLHSRMQRSVRHSVLEVVRAPRVRIVGGGWYGCHAARRLRHAGLQVELHERHAQLFSESSQYNQNRLHLGYHYPRSYDTRRMCAENYQKFMYEYAECTRAIPHNVYAVANDSALDAATYVQIMRSSGLPVHVARDAPFTHCEAAFQVDERFICPHRARRMFTALLDGIVRYNSPLQAEQLPALFAHADVVLDCTNNQLCPGDSDVAEEETLSLLYRRVKNRDQLAAWTVMDGALPSLYPFDADEHVYSLTHVTYTAEGCPGGVVSDAVRARFERAASYYIPVFADEFQYEGHFVSKKAKRVSSCASRTLRTVYSRDAMVSFSCGKITGIYDMDSELLELFDS